MMRFKASVVERKRCPCYLADEEENAKNATEPSSLIIVSGSYIASGDRYRSFVERMIRWFKKTQGVQLSAEWERS
jgi:hypothetical protein